MNTSSSLFSNGTNVSTIMVENLLSKITLGVFLSALAMFTVVGNILVLYAIQTEKNLRTVSNLFILSLASADLAVGFFVMPLSAATIIAGRWPFSPLICKMWLSIDYVASTASIFNLVLLSLDRYWAVVHPLRYLQERTRRRATIFILFVWFISSLWAPAVMFWSFIFPNHSDIIHNHECDTSFRLNKTFKTLTALVNFYLPLLTMILISCRIMVAIRSRSKMELGRRLSSSTQKKMKRNHISTKTSGYPEIQKSLKANEEERASSSSSSSLAQNALDSSPAEYFPVTQEKALVNIERGQCFCSTCSTYGNSRSESLWTLQAQPTTKPTIQFKKRLSFSPLKNISVVFSSGDQTNKSSGPSKFIDEDSTNHSDFSKEKESISFSNENQASTLQPLHLKLASTSTNISKSSANSQRALKTTSFTSIVTDEQSDVSQYHQNDQRKSRKLDKFPNGQTSTASSQSTPIFNPSSPKSIEIQEFILEEQDDKLANKVIRVNGKYGKQLRKTQSYRKRSISNFLNHLINPSQSTSLQKELKAARQLGMLVGVFTVSWLPYFILFLVVAWCNDCVSNLVFTSSIWLGYLNSALNPLIYPLCNIHFRQAFLKICRCKHAKTKLPNLIALRELHALHSRNGRR